MIVSDAGFAAARRREVHMACFESKRFLTLLFSVIVLVAALYIPVFADGRDDGSDEQAAPQYTVTFDAGYKWPSGRNIPREIGNMYTTVSKTYPDDETAPARVGELPVRYRLGHVMTGWYTKKKGGERIKSSTIVQGNVTYYAHWKKATANQIATYIAKQAKKEKTAAKQIQAATDAVTVFVAMNKYKQKGKYYNKPEGVFVKAISTCAGECRALGLVIEKMGYKWEHINENKQTHQWVVVYTKKNRKGARWADANFIKIGDPPNYFQGASGKGKKPPYV
jgi:uncharacterized repeat protein (TIGR02543 family)